MTASYSRSLLLDPSVPVDKYINCDFILGSAAEIERVWSTAGLIMTSRRKGTSPLTLEALLFLEYNKDYWWDCPILVQKAMAMKSPKRKNVATYDMDYNAAQAALSENEDTSDDLTSDDLSID